MNNPIIFLDYDGVVNTIYWREYPRNPEHPRGIFRADFAHASDGFVNNFQAICWLNETYKKCPYDIVVSSTWRVYDNYIECLYNAGLNKDIKVIGKTPRLDGNRGDEIKQWINDNQFTGKYAILDDDADMGDIIDHLVQCDTNYGYNINEMYKVLEKIM